MMKKFVLVCLSVLALAASACGTATKQQSAQEQAAVSTADKAVQRCLPSKDGTPDLLVLKSHAARQQFIDCAVPQRKRVAFNACITRVVLSGLPTKHRLEAGFSACLKKVEA